MKSVFMVIAVAVGLTVFSWLITCGIVKILAMCFGLDFTWGAGTGVWLILFLLKCLQRESGGNKK